MNSILRSRLSRVAIAAFLVGILGACGADVENAPGDFPPAQAPAGPKPGNPDQNCFGSALHGEVACHDDDAPATGTPQGGLGRPGSGPEGWT
ncbi:MAG: hypothetical protein ACRDOM_08700 [Nocardioides sp.]